MQHSKWLLGLMIAGLFLVSGAVTYAQDATPEATSAPLELTQHYVTDDEQVAFSYPKDWVLDLRTPSEGYYVDGRLGSSQSVLDKDLGTFGDGLDSGEVYMEVAIVEVTTLIGDLKGVTTESSPADILQKAFEANGSGDITFGKVVSLEVDGKPAARLDGHTKKGADGFILIVELGQGVIGGMSVGAPAGELPQWESTVQAIAESMTYAGGSEATPEATAESTSVPVPELTQTIKSENSSVVVKYPANWVARSDSNTQIYIAPDQDSLDVSFGDSFKSGQVKILIEIDTPENLISEMQLPLEADASVEKMLQATVKAASSIEGIEFSAVTSTVVDDEPAAFTQFSGQGYEGLAWVAEHDTFSRMLIQVLAAPGEADQWKDLALAVAAEAAYPG